MSRVHGGDTEPERIVRSLLHTMGYRFRLHVRKLPGNPDVVLPRRHRVVFVHGCFWHGHKRCTRAGRPATRVAFWNRKIDGNVVRDAAVRKRLKALGWKVLVIWQCETKQAKRAALVTRLRRFLE
jgi:DNA mismatch endonuclease (patch repair protein)